MALGDFAWCDLATFHVAGTKAFYTDLFGWTYESIRQADGALYHLASTRAGPCAAIFEMPESFQAIRLPSFWMSYIQVKDMGQAVDIARQLGGRVELGPVPFGSSDKIALIRDPLGAGFTLYAGSDLEPRPSKPKHGHTAWNALYVSDATAVAGFYRSLFNWQIIRDPKSPERYSVLGAQQAEIAALYELPDEIRGSYQFWGVHFAVDDLTAACSRALDGGANQLYADKLSVLLADPDGAAFFLTSSGS